MTSPSGQLPVVNRGHRIGRVGRCHKARFGAVFVDVNDERHLYSLVVSETHDGNVGEYVVFTYSDGTSDSTRMTLFDASTFAETNGLTRVPTSDDTLRWERL